MPGLMTTIFDACWEVTKTFLVRDVLKPPPEPAPTEPQAMSQQETSPCPYCAISHAVVSAMGHLDHMTDPRTNKPVSPLKSWPLYFELVQADITTALVTASSSDEVNAKVMQNPQLAATLNHLNEVQRWIGKVVSSQEYGPATIQSLRWELYKDALVLQGFARERNMQGV